jgi:hypothetical protein
MLLAMRVDGQRTIWVGDPASGNAVAVRNAEEWSRFVRWGYVPVDENGRGRVWDAPSENTLDYYFPNRRV